ncbi:PAS domain S-box protein [Methanofollis aquaemaris]|uniref:histidine kinase n=1 Tax=Methanofollis aquaemaris TaxID=126734 RepID=A0A8A3S3C2_9EURY|nr:PAS domain-containing protein [Methanofollis aquaemaris]QSZ66241.1 PAS domain S-box protein [Methanofollis aquaemaris]
MKSPPNNSLSGQDDAPGFLQRLVDSISIPLFYKDTRQVYLGCNTAYTEFIGLQKDEIIGKTVYDIFPPEFAETYQIRDTELLANAGVQQYEFSFRSGDGRTRRVVFYKATYADRSGNVAGLVGIVLDITEQRNAEERLRHSEEKFRMLFETMNQGVVYQDAEGGIIDANPAAEAILGLARARLLGKTLTDPCWDAACEDGEEHPAEAALQSGIKSRKLVGIRDPISDEEKWVMTSTIPQGGNKVAQPYHQFTTLVDLTTEIQAERALQHSEAEKALILNSVDEVMIYLDSDYRIIWINDATSILLGIKKEEIIGRRCYEVIWGGSEQCPWCRIPRVVESGKAVSDDVTLGDSRIFHMTTYPVRDEMGAMVGYIEKGIDVTEITRTRQALEEANRKLALLSGITRHDILNLVMALTFYNGEVEKGLPKDSELAPLVGKIKETTRWIEEQISFTRDYEDLGVHGAEWLRVSDLLQRAATVIPGEIAYTESVGDLEVFADPLLEKVFYNLFENAASHGGRVTEVSVSFVPGDPTGTIAIEDDGVGVPTSEKERIFQKGVGRKTGLGLFLSKEVLEISGIEIRETGGEGEGARFEILVPVGAYRSGQA